MESREYEIAELQEDACAIMRDYAGARVAAYVNGGGEASVMREDREKLEALVARAYEAGAERVRRIIAGEQRESELAERTAQDELWARERRLG